MKPFTQFLVTAVLLFVAGLAQAQANGQQPRPSLQDILAQQREIQADLQAGNKYRGVDPYRRAQIDAAQKKVFGLLQGRQSLSELKADDQLIVFNALKSIESHLVKVNEDDRMVCERAALAGTRRYTKVCMTESDRRRKADKAKEALMERAACTTSRCIGG